ncbi:holo-ACP synthase [Streptomyces sp. NPDC006743]|uniref:holo-ACP synthase n=1 Tax=Streptomyces sp. NPDC006743 TaxID=3154480 RepID=UPI00345644DC
MIVGIGNDVADIERFRAALARTPCLASRLFTARERTGPDGRPRDAASLSARFAVKEAVLKVLGAPAGLAWDGIETVTLPSGRPVLRVSGAPAERAAALGIRDWHVSISHDGNLAAALVVAEGGGGRRRCTRVCGRRGGP